MKKAIIFISAFFALLLLVFTHLTASAAFSRGDVNNDGALDAVDARLILRHVAKLDTLTGAALKAADADGSGEVDAGDARIVLRVTAKLQKLPDISGDSEDAATMEKETEKKTAAKPETTKREPFVTRPRPTEAATEPQSVAAPSTDIVKVVEKYNKAANDTKNYMGKVKVTKLDGSYIEITRMPTSYAWLKPIVYGLLPNDYPRAPETREFNKGKSLGISRISLNGFIPPEQLSAVNLGAAGVESAKFTPKANGSGTYDIILKPEVMDGFAPPTYNGQAAEYLDIIDEDIEPFQFLDGTVAYAGTTITVEVNKDGLMTKYYATVPVVMKGNFGYGAQTLMEGCELSGFWKSELEFIYS
ncbi:MAG: dockerin type I repeat-containing protein [Oscillospiraceae bacterium]|nr:dockerin type I repeat-containing protein [Oscillospiraceae bacterium]